MSISSILRHGSMRLALSNSEMISMAGTRALMRPFHPARPVAEGNGFAIKAIFCPILGYTIDVCCFSRVSLHGLGFVSRSQLFSALILIRCCERRPESIQLHIFYIWRFEFMKSAEKLLASMCNRR